MARPSNAPLPLAVRRTAARGFAVVLGLALVLGCGSGDDATGPRNDNDDDPPRSEVPEEHVGTWRLQDAGDQYCDPATGQCTTSYARSESLRLTGEGRFDRALYFESNFPPCSMVVHHESESTVEVQGSTLTVHSTEGVTRVQDNCGESFEENESGETDRYTWEITDGEGGESQLVLTDAEGNTIGPFELES